MTKVVKKDLDSKKKTPPAFSLSDCFEYAYKEELKVLNAKPSAITARKIEVIRDAPETLINPIVHHKFYVRNLKGRAIGCVAFETQVQSASEKGKFMDVKYGHATHNPKEPWDKARGWIIANRRLDKKDNKSFIIDVCDNGQCMIKVMELLLLDEKVSQRMKRHLKQMLKTKENRAV